MSGRFTTRLAEDLRTARPLRRPAVDNTPNRYMTVPDGHELLTYEVNIDWADVSLMALKAGANKSGKSNSGPIQVVVTKREVAR